MSAHLKCDYAVTTAYFMLEFCSVTNLRLLRRPTPTVILQIATAITYRYFKWHKSRLKYDFYNSAA